MSVLMKTQVLWHMTPCRLLSIYWRFGEDCFLHIHSNMGYLRPRGWRQPALLACYQQTRCRFRTLQGVEWLRQVLHSNNSYKNKVFLVPFSFCAPDTKHTKILRNSFRNLTNIHSNHACITLETEINLNYIWSSSSYRAVNTPRAVF